MTNRVRIFAVGVGLAGALAACGSSSSSSGASSPKVANSSSSTSSSSAPAKKIAGTVSANSATSEELTAAFTAAGIEPADRWAREVGEYRPYPNDDPTFAKLRQELSKYNPSPELVDKIVATLSLP